MDASSSAMGGSDQWHGFSSSAGSGSKGRYYQDKFAAEAQRMFDESRPEVRAGFSGPNHDKALQELRKIAKNNERKKELEREMSKIRKGFEKPRPVLPPSDLLTPRQLSIFCDTKEVKENWFFSDLLLSPDVASTLFPDFANEIIAFSIAERYLNGCGHKIDLANSEHQKILYVALNRNEPDKLDKDKLGKTHFMWPLTMLHVESRIRQEATETAGTVDNLLKDVIIGALSLTRFAPVSSPVGDRVSGVLTHRDKRGDDKISDHVLKRILPEKLTEEEYSQVVKLNLSDKARDYLQLRGQQELRADVASIRSAMKEMDESSIFPIPWKQGDAAITKERLEEFLPRIRADQIPQLLEMDLTDEARGYLYLLVKRDIEAENVGFNECEKKRREINYAQAASQFAQGLKTVAREYFALKESDAQYRRQRRALSKEFDKLCEACNLKLPTNTLSSSSTFEDTLKRIDSRHISKSLADQARAAEEFTVGYKKHSEQLLLDLDKLQKEKGSLEERKKKFEETNRKIQKHYNNKLKRSENLTKIIGSMNIFFEGLAVAANAAAAFAPLTFPLASSVAAAAQCASFVTTTGKGFVDSNLSSLSHKYRQKLERQEEEGRMIGYLSNKVVAELLQLQGQKKGEIYFLIQHREFIEPDAYREHLEGAKTWLEQQELPVLKKGVADAEAAINKLRKEKLNYLDHWIEHYESRGVETLNKDEKICYNNHKRRREELTPEENRLNSNLKEAKGKVTDVDETIGKAVCEIEAVDFAVPVTREIHAHSEQAKKDSPDYKMRHLRGELERLFAIKADLKVAPHLETVGELAKMFAQELDFWNNSNKASIVAEGGYQVIRMIRAAEAFINFLSIVNLSNKGLTNPDTSQMESGFFDSYGSKIEFWDNIFHNLQLMGPEMSFMKGVVPTFMFFHASASLVRCYKTYHNPRENPMLQGIRKMLTKQLEKIGKTFEWLHENLTGQNKQMMHEIVESKNAILTSLGMVTSEVVDHADQVSIRSYVDKTMSRRQKFEDIIRESNRDAVLPLLRDRIAKAREVNQNGILALSGVKDGGDLSLVVKNPHLFTGFLFNELFGEGDLANYYLLHSVLYQFSNFVQSHRKSGVELSKMPMESYLSMTKKEMDRFTRLLKFPSKKLNEAHANRKILLDFIQKRHTRSKEKHAQVVQKRLDTALNDLEVHKKGLVLDKRSGSKKFIASQVVTKHPMKSKEDPLCDVFEGFFVNLVMSPLWTTVSVVGDVFKVLKEPKKKLSDTLSFVRGQNLLSTASKIFGLVPGITIADRSYYHSGFSRIANQILCDYPLSRYGEIQGNIRHAKFTLLTGDEIPFPARLQGSYIQTQIAARKAEEMFNKVRWTRTFTRTGTVFDDNSRVGVHHTTSNNYEIDLLAGDCDWDGKDLSRQLFLEFNTKFTLNDEIETQVEATERSYIQKRDFTRIPSKYLLEGMQSEEDYDRAVTRLIDSYFEFLESNKKEGKPLPELHSFGNIQNQCQVLPSREGKLVPLAFPKALMKALDKKIEHERFSLGVTNIGALIPSYSFEWNGDKKRYELAIVYNLVRSNEDREQHYCDIVIADFDKDTVDAFKSIILNKEEFQICETNLNEFLIQMMYSSFEPNIGFPGRGSYRLEKGDLVAPEEWPFSGFYSVFDESPGRMKRFTCEGFIGRDSIVERRFTVRPDPVVYLTVYSETEIKMEEIKNPKGTSGLGKEVFGMTIEFSKALREYKRNYQLLQALFRLSSNCSVEELTCEMDRQLDLTPPDDVQAFFDEVECGVTRDSRGLDITRFISLLNANPSETCTSIDRHLDNLRNIEKWVDDIKGKLPELRLKGMEEEFSTLPISG